MVTGRSGLRKLKRAAFCLTPQSELGDVVYVEVPEVGATLKKGDSLGVVESVKVG